MSTQGAPWGWRHLPPPSVLTGEPSSCIREVGACFPKAVPSVLLHTKAWRWVPAFASQQVPGGLTTLGTETKLTEMTCASSPESSPRGPRFLPTPRMAQGSARPEKDHRSGVGNVDINSPDVHHHVSMHLKHAFTVNICITRYTGTQRHHDDRDTMSALKNPGAKAIGDTAL